MKKNGLLFAVLPTTTMNSSDDKSGGITWRENLLKRHTLISVIKLPEKLFSPQVLKGTYGVVIRAGRPHEKKNKVLWAVLHDGIVKTKTKDDSRNNVEKILKTFRDFMLTNRISRYIPEELDFSPIKANDMDLSPEGYIRGHAKSLFNISDVQYSAEDAKRLLKRPKKLIDKKFAVRFSHWIFLKI